MHSTNTIFIAATRSLVFKSKTRRKQILWIQRCRMLPLLPYPRIDLSYPHHQLLFKIIIHQRLLFTVHRPHSTCHLHNIITRISIDIKTKQVTIQTFLYRRIRIDNNSKLIITMEKMSCLQTFWGLRKITNNSRIKVQTPIACPLIGWCSSLATNRVSFLPKHHQLLFDRPLPMADDLPLDPIIPLMLVKMTMVLVIFHLS